MDEQALISDAAAVIGEDQEILAAGIFDLREDYAKIAVAGLATGAAADALGATGALAQGAVAGVTVHETRRLNAESKGVTTRMLVAVTAGTSIRPCGSAAPFNPEAAGDKLVLNLLSAPG